MSIDIAIHPALQSALEKKGYETLTSVQHAVGDPALAEQDLLVSAQTGSGKTVAFGLAMSAQLLAEGLHTRADVPRAIVIAPTRELALQVKRELEWLYAEAGMIIAGAVGGMDPRNERRQLERGAHIVVGTPGRICDHIRRNALDLSELQVAVLDEADEMLDLGFREDLEFILNEAPEERRTLMFSATVSPEIERLAGTFQKDAQRISTIDRKAQHSDIEYRALVVDRSDRENAIVNLLRFYEAHNAIVFCGTRAMVTHLTTKLLNRGFAVVALSGELSQEERSRALQMMRDGRARVCIATDVAARGIDLPGLELVIHADLPQNKEALLHRSGRTGRAGSKGVSALVVPINIKAKAERLLKFANLTADWAPAPSAEEVQERDSARMMEMPSLTDLIEADENDAVQALAARFDKVQLAAAVVRAFRAGRSAPEDITPISVDGPKPRAKVEFERSTWMRLSMGRDSGTDPKWLLPMLCRAGDLTRRDIGAIRIMNDHTFVQIHADAADRFLQSVGPERSLEDKCGVDVLDKAPEGLDRPNPRPAKWDKKPGGPRRHSEGRDFGDRGDREFKKPHRKGDSDDGAPRKSFKSRDEFGEGKPAKFGKPAAGKSFKDKPNPKDKGKPKAKYGKPGKK
ncbi:DEAD/DEAH box helicase [Thioclava sp. GXIMD2076]|uniref:DEAD/DEAH box helicase n=1 Tax=Thioclava sp. GXIMD2076 TaxID=3131931 RepID=UPI0030CE6E9C